MDFLSTHPANERRIKAIRKWLPEACFPLPLSLYRSLHHWLMTLSAVLTWQADQLREDNCGPTAQSSRAFNQAVKFR